MNGEKIENMLSQLIRMVGSIQSTQQEMKAEIQIMKTDQHEMNADFQSIKIDQQEMKADLKSMKSQIENLDIKQEERHKEILDRFKSLENDQDFIWEKTARNEREIGNIKRQLS
ncbi:hypothetical protein NSQ59_04665 [Margalitia sp. FSL K6-0131]|uniref:hypothetical protein n=1 Tax=Margalitia sp. FSL K6-0131 TaxID=2954604 RepID=UPI0030F6572F